MQILEHQQQRTCRRDRLQRVPDLAQHALPSGAQDLTLQHLAMFAFHQGRKLNQPRRGLRGQGPDHRLAFGTPAQLTQCIQHRVVSFLASVALHALAAHYTNARHVSRCLALEFVGQGGFPYTRLAGNKDDLTLFPQRFRERTLQLTECRLPANQFSG